MDAASPEQPAVSTGARKTTMSLSRPVSNSQVTHDSHPWNFVIQIYANLPKRGSTGRPSKIFLLQTISIDFHVVISCFFSDMKTTSTSLTHSKLFEVSRAKTFYLALLQSNPFPPKFRTETSENIFHQRNGEIPA